MKYSIWGQMYGSERDSELAQVDSNPQAVLNALAAKTLSITNSILPGARKTKVRKYSWLRIVNNDHHHESD